MLQIVDYLNEKGIQAIMFAVGWKLEQHPEQAKYALQHGMIMGNHSYSHPAFSTLSMEESAKEIEACEELLNQLYQSAGVKRDYRPFRFPFGDKGGKNKAALQRYLAEKKFSKVKDTQISFAWWKENGLDRGYRYILFSLGNNNQFVINRKSSELVSMPITVMAILMLVVWPFSLVVLFVGLFLGTRHSFRGPDINSSVNQVMDKAQNKAASAVEIHVGNNNAQVE